MVLRLLKLLLYLKLYSNGIRFTKDLKIDGIPRIVKSKDSQIIFGRNLLIRKNVEIRAIAGSTVIIKNNVKIDNGVRIIAANGETVSIGNNAKIGYFSVLNGGGGIKIHDDVSLYGFVYLQTSIHHDRGHLALNYKDKKFSHAPIEIGCRTILGPHCTIMPGVNIGEKCTINGNLLVKENVPDGSLKE
jgi:acetyltransferase-like isoleucine patch superfamily enzyme